MQNLLTEIGADPHTPSWISNARRAIASASSAPQRLMNDEKIDFSVTGFLRIGPNRSMIEATT